MVSIAFHSSSPSRARILASRRPSMTQRLRSAFGAVATEWHVRQAVRAVEALDVRLLLDIGVAPGGIEDAVRHGR